MTKRATPVELVLCNEPMSTEQMTDYLRSLGYQDSEITRLLSHQPRTAYYLIKSPSVPKSQLAARAIAGMGLGWAIGMIVAGAVGAVIALGTSIYLPASELLIPGPLVGGLAGGSLGGLIGGFAGLFLGACASNRALGDMGVGGAIGMSLGGTIAAVAALGTNMAIPGLGYIVSGPTAWGLIGAGAGGAIAGFVGLCNGSLRSFLRRSLSRSQAITIAAIPELAKPSAVENH